MLILEQVTQLDEKLGHGLITTSKRDRSKTPGYWGKYFSSICRTINKDLSRQFQALSPEEAEPLLKIIGLQKKAKDGNPDAFQAALEALPGRNGPWLSPDTLRKCWDKLPNLVTVATLVLFTDFDLYSSHPQLLASDTETYRHKWKTQLYDQNAHIRLRKLMGDYAFYLVPAPDSGGTPSRAILSIAVKGTTLTTAYGGRTTTQPVELGFNKGKLPTMSIGSKHLEMTCHPFATEAKGIDRGYFWVLGMAPVSNSPFVYIGKCEALESELPPLEKITERIWPGISGLNKMWLEKDPGALPQVKSGVTENQEAHKLLEGHYNGFGIGETSTALESVSFFVSNYIFEKGRIRVSYPELGGEMVFEALGNYLVVDRFYVIYIFLEGFVYTGIAAIPTTGSEGPLEIAYAGNLQAKGSAVFSGIAICEKVASADDFLMPGRELPRLDGDTLRIAGEPTKPIGTPQEYVKKLKKLPAERLWKIKQLETLLRYRSLPILCSELPQSFQTGTWTGTASGPDAQGMHHGEGEKRNCWLTINLSFLGSFSYLDGYLTIINGQLGQALSEERITSWKLMAKGRENGVQVHHSCLAFIPDKQLKPPFFLLGSSLLQLDGEKTKAEGNYLFQCCNEGGGTSGQAQGTLLLERLEEERCTQGSLLRLHCDRLSQHFPNQDRDYFTEYSDRGY